MNLVVWSLHLTFGCLGRQLQKEDDQYLRPQSLASFFPCMFLEVNLEDGNELSVMQNVFSFWILCIALDCGPTDFLSQLNLIVHYNVGYTQVEYRLSFSRTYIKGLWGLMDVQCSQPKPMLWMMSFQGFLVNKWNIIQVIQMLTGLTDWEVKWIRWGPTLSSNLFLVYARVLKVRVEIVFWLELCLWYFCFTSLKHLNSFLCCFLHTDCDAYFILFLIYVFYWPLFTSSATALGAECYDTEHW